MTDPFFLASPTNASVAARLTRGPIPLYHQINQILRSRIHSQEYKPGNMLATEDEMMAQFGVSRTTVRQALQLLSNEGLIIRVPGKGTFVSENAVQRQREWPTIQTLAQIVECGHLTELKILNIKMVPANETLATTFRIAPGTEVWELRGLRQIKGEPFFYITLYVPLDLASRVPRKELEKELIVSLIERYCGLRVVEILQWTSASLADKEVANNLQLKVGDPLLVYERHFITANDRVVQVSIDLYRTDRTRHFLRWRRSEDTDNHEGKRPNPSAQVDIIKPEADSNHKEVADA